MKSLQKVLILTSTFILLAAFNSSQASLLPPDTDGLNETTAEVDVQAKSNDIWYPFQRVFHVYANNECPERPPAVEEFPTIWTREQRLRGLFLVHVIIAIYCFIVLAFVCDKYFLPTVERICEVLKISPDVAATTFMATATTIPEFFANTIATFIADNDMGLSAIIGSMLFNTLGVAACASLFVKKPIQIDWWPITRDSLLLIFNLSLLITFAWDGMIMWWEATILVVFLVLFWILMFQNKRIVRGVKYVIEERLLWCQRIANYDIANQRPKTQAEIDGVAVPEVKPYSDPEASNFQRAKERRQSTDIAVIYAEPEEDEYELYEIPKGVSVFQLFWYFFTWPIRFLLHYTIPHPKRWSKVFPLSFLMCVIWIALMSYIVFWMVAIVGYTFLIPDPVMALTFLAFGGCMPEAISAVIVARKGSGQMGVSNALGANCLAILFSLGLPWFIRTMADGAGWNGAYIRIYSFGVEFTLIAVIFAVVLLYIVMAAAGYKLRKIVGGFLFAGYLGFATFAILNELDIIFESDC